MEVLKYHLSISFYASVPNWICEIPNHLEIQCDEPVITEPYSLEFAPNRFKTQEIRNKVVFTKPNLLQYVSDRFLNQGMCDGATGEHPYSLELAPDCFKTKEMYDKRVMEVPWQLHCVPNHFKI